MEKKKESIVLALIALIIGILALILSWVPIVNNLAAIFAVIGFILAIIALIINRKNKKTLSIVGLVISIVAFVIVMATQAFYAKSIDDAFKNTSSGSKVAKKVEESKPTQSSQEKENENNIFKVGETVSMDNVEFKVNKVSYSNGGEMSKPNDGNQYVIVNVTITNKGDESVDYNPYDFKLDSNGNQTSLSEYATDDDGNNLAGNELSSGTLAKGGSVTGSMVGQAKKGDKYKLIYTGNMFFKDSKITFELN
ncbi:MAG: DUF4352 domain-containing protein [Lactococcus hircilactis]